MKKIVFEEKPEKRGKNRIFLILGKKGFYIEVSPRCKFFG
jgi:hypothetical protein